MIKPASWIRLSIFMMLFSFLPWLMMFTVAWWPLPASQRAATATGLFVFAEILFWVGAAIGGTEVVKHRRAFGVLARRRLGPVWRRWLRLRQRKPCPPNLPG